MSKAAAEIDFLGLEEGEYSSTFGHETSSARGVPSSMPKLATQLERAGITSARAAISTSAAPAATDEGFVAGAPDNLLFFSPLPSPAEQCRRSLAAMPAWSHASRSAAGPSKGGAAPLTIFYNGTVATFNLPRDKAEAIIKWTERTTSGVQPSIERPAADAFVSGPLPSHFLLNKLGGDLPLARKRSLQRFLEKRKER